MSSASDGPRARTGQAGHLPVVPLFSTATPSRRRRLRRLVTPRRALLSALLACAAVGVGYAFSASEDTVQAPRFGDRAVEQVFPAADDLELRQTRIGIDLVPGYTGVLAVDGVEIPEDQYQRVDPLNQVFFVAAPGSETGALEPGRHCAKSRFWRVGEARETGRDFTWCFNVH